MKAFLVAAHRGDDRVEELVAVHRAGQLLQNASLPFREQVQILKSCLCVADKELKLRRSCAKRELVSVAARQRDDNEAVGLVRGGFKSVRGLAEAFLCVRII